MENMKFSNAYTFTISIHLHRRAGIEAALSVLGFALVLIILGIFNGGMQDVVEKAIKICTECIGLG